MRMIILLKIVFLISISITAEAQLANRTQLDSNMVNFKSQWKGKNVAFLGDSMTDKNTLPNTTLYWENLADMLGIKAYSYGKNGHKWTDIHNQAKQLHEDKITNLDAIIIFAGTNDYMANIPIGKFTTETWKQTISNGKEVNRKFQTNVNADSTFCGRINVTLSYLKSHFPDQQIIIMTPIHRGFAKFSANNIQPDERFANEHGLYIEDYVHALLKAGTKWSVPVIDLFSLAGLYPLEESNHQYFNDNKTDLLHPNSNGHHRLAKTIYYQLLQLPSNFR